MLFNLVLHYNNGEKIEELHFQESSIVTLYPKYDDIKHSDVQRFKYHYKGKIAPSIIKTLSGTYTVPGWVKIHDKSTLDDIVWKKPKIKSRVERIWKYKSKTNGEFYIIKKQGKRFTCTCMGYFRSKTHECKHIRAAMLA